MPQRYTIPRQVAVHVNNALISRCQENYRKENRFSDYLTLWVKAEAYGNFKLIAYRIHVHIDRWGGLPYLNREYERYSRHQGYTLNLAISESCDDCPYFGVRLSELDRVSEAQIFKAWPPRPIQVAATVRGPPLVHHCLFAERNFP